jgi:hypothetical protein
MGCEINPNSFRFESRRQDVASWQSSLDEYLKEGAAKREAIGQPATLFGPALAE